MWLVRRGAWAALGIPFIWLGFGAVSNPGGRVASAERLGIPRARDAVRLNGAAMVAGGAALASGVLPRTAALGLAASLVPTTLAGHAFWLIEDPQTRNAQRTQALKNLAMIGGLLAVVASRPHRAR